MRVEMEKCKGCKKYSHNSDCKECEPDYKPTNADRIRAMSDEELAEFFNKFDNICGMCSKNIGCFIVDTDRCKKNILDWLQSEAE